MCQRYLAGRVWHLSSWTYDQRSAPALSIRYNTSTTASAFDIGATYAGRQRLHDPPRGGGNGNCARVGQVDRRRGALPPAITHRIHSAGFKPRSATSASSIETRSAVSVLRSQRRAGLRALGRDPSATPCVRRPRGHRACRRPTWAATGENRDRQGQRRGHATSRPSPVSSRACGATRSCTRLGEAARGCVRREFRWDHSAERFLEMTPRRGHRDSAAIPVDVSPAALAQRQQGARVG